MKESLIIKWDSGQMEIILGEFFPTTVETLKKLFKVIRLNWLDRDEVFENLNVYFQEKQAEHESLFQDYRECYLESKATLEKISRNQRDTYSKIKYAVRQNFEKAKVHEYKVKQFKRHIELLNMERER